jgi:UTP-glucose-1-phosphate uridylyltransferase
MQTLRDDEQLRPLMRQLVHHLDSMESNTASIRGLGHAITRAHAAVDDVLRRRGIGLSAAERDALASIA